MGSTYITQANHANKLSSRIAPATEVNGIVRSDALLLSVDGEAAAQPERVMRQKAFKLTQDRYTGVLLAA